ncbi:MAG: hypothetical protein NTX79_03750 [Candidatus Micrarchaeota archaeon]|nr:hypothetical protein [Candidatus Micrarchaeota archaeon]
MAKMALQGGWCFNTLRSEVAGALSRISTRAETINVDPGGKAKEKLEKIRGELAGIREKVPKESTSQAYNELLRTIIRLGDIERELSLLDFYGQMK